MCFEFKQHDTSGGRQTTESLGHETKPTFFDVKGPTNLETRSIDIGYLPYS